jgi:hypothetical protein
VAPGRSAHAPTAPRPGAHPGATDRWYMLFYSRSDGQSCTTICQTAPTPPPDGETERHTSPRVGTADDRPSAGGRRAAVRHVRHGRGLAGWLPPRRPRDRCGRGCRRRLGQLRRCVARGVPPGARPGAERGGALAEPGLPAGGVTGGADRPLRARGALGGRRRSPAPHLAPARPLAGLDPRSPPAQAAPPHRPTLERSRPAAHERGQAGGHPVGPDPLRGAVQALQAR